MYIREKLKNFLINKIWYDSTKLSGKMECSVTITPKKNRGINMSAINIHGIDSERTTTSDIKRKVNHNSY